MWFDDWVTHKFPCRCTHTRAHARTRTRCTGPRLWCNGPTAINRNLVLFCAQLVIHTVKDLCTMFVSLVSEGPRELESGETNIYAVSYNVTTWLDVVSRAFGSWWKDWKLLTWWRQCGRRFHNQGRIFGRHGIGTRDVGPRQRDPDLKSLSLCYS